MNIIDLLAILPYYVEVMSGNSVNLQVFRILRLARVRSRMSTAHGWGGGGGWIVDTARAADVSCRCRRPQVFRVFKLGKYSTNMQMMGRVFKRSLDAMLLLLFFIALGIVVFGSLIFFAEAGAWPTCLH
jgi:hypothetical protein